MSYGYDCACARAGDRTRLSLLSGSLHSLSLSLPPRGQNCARCTAPAQRPCSVRALCARRRHVLRAAHRQCASRPSVTHRTRGTMHATSPSSQFCSIASRAIQPSRQRRSFPHQRPGHTNKIGMAGWFADTSCAVSWRGILRFSLCVCSCLSVCLACVRLRALWAVSVCLVCLADSVCYISTLDVEHYDIECLAKVVLSAHIVDKMCTFLGSPVSKVHQSI